MIDYLSGNSGKSKITPTKMSSFELVVNSPGKSISSTTETKANRVRLIASKMLPSVVIAIIDDIVFSGTMPKWKGYIKSLESINTCEDQNINVNHIGSVTNYTQILAYFSQNVLYLTLYCIDIVLRGISQVYLCDNPITGVCICIGLLCTHTTIFIYAIIGCVFSTISAYLILHPRDRSELESGLYGYDGTLVGGAIYTFLSVSKSELISPSLTNSGLGITIIMSCTAGVIHCSCLNMNKLPALTLAFNIVTCGLFLSLARGMSEVATMAFLIDAEDTNTVSVNEDVPWEAVTFEYFVGVCFKSVGQFCFVSTTLGGVFVWLGIGVASRRAAALALLGAIIAFIVARYIIALPPSSHILVREGIYGYNAMGTCVAIGGGIFFEKGFSATCIAIFGSMLTVFTQLVVASVLNTDELSLPVLTIPFVLTTWMIMLTHSTHLTPPVPEVNENQGDFLQQLEHEKTDDSWLHGKSLAMDVDLGLNMSIGLGVNANTSASASTDHLISNMHDNSHPNSVTTTAPTATQVDNIYSKLHDTSANSNRNGDIGMTVGGF